MQLLLPVAIAAMAVLGGGIALHHAGFFEHLATPDVYPSDHCHEVPLVPLVADPTMELRPVEFVIDNRGEADKGIVCIFDANLVKRFQKEFDVAAATVVTYGFDVPADWFFAQTIMGDPVAQAATGRGGWNSGGNWIKPCDQGTTQIPTTTTMDGKSRTSVGEEERCAASQMSLDGESLIPSGDGSGPGSGAVVATAVVGSGIAIGLVVWGKHLGWFAFFTRLHRPTLLDHERRARIVDLVEADPGIHGSDIAETLELAPGVATHHLSILTRERLLTKVGGVGFRHYFVYGKFSPARMRALAAARRPAARRILDALDQSPGSSLSALSATTGLSIGRLSRLAKQLEASNVVRRRSQGRKVVVERVPLPA